MPGPAPDGQPAPADGGLPDVAIRELTAQRALSWYLHVPFCRTRCGYCDFNTYTAGELEGAAPQQWADTAIAEVRLARQVLGGVDAPAPTLFFGGGTPTLLPATELGRVIAAVSAEFGICPGAEITVEANPDDVSAELLDGLLLAGVSRISLGVQSADPQTLRTLERSHRAQDLPDVVHRIRAAGVPSMSMDLIYGTPGESAAQWEATLRTTLALGPDHISAYCLGIEQGTRLGAALRRGLIRPVDQDEAADRYEAADEALSAHGYSWYEISNWAKPGQQCRHNLVYWRNGAWWGAGPGAHSHVGGVRWWNLRHPRGWSAALQGRTSPAQAREVLSEEQRAEERVLLGIRLAQGLQVHDLPLGTVTAAGWINDGLAEWLEHGKSVRLTRSGRLLADMMALQALSATT